MTSRDSNQQLGLGYRITGRVMYIRPVRGEFDICMKAYFAFNLGWFAHSFKVAN